MNRFMGGFATAAVMLGAAAVAGHVWLAAGFGVATVILATFAMVRYFSRGDAPPVQRDPYAEPHVFAGRGDSSGRPPRNRR